MGRFTFATAALIGSFAVMTAPTALLAQKWDDEVPITLANPVTVGGKVLQPGNYTVKQMDIAGGDLPVVVIRGDGDTRVDADVIVTPALQNRVQPATRILYYHVGDSYYFDTIWVKGWSYGFKFKPPKGVKPSK